MEQTRKIKKEAIMKNGVPILSISMVIIAIMIWFMPFQKKSVLPQNDFSQINKLAEMATTRCYYHNIVEIEDDPDVVFKYGLFRFGYKRFWMEYTGVITVGVDTSKMKIKVSDDIVKILMPKAEVLQSEVDVASMSDPIVETGLFTTITANEKAQALNKAQMEMKEKAMEDQHILIQAYTNAKQIIQNYVNKINEITGAHYIIEWLEE